MLTPIHAQARTGGEPPTKTRLIQTALMFLSFKEAPLRRGCKPDIQAIVIQEKFVHF